MKTFEYLLLVLCVLMVGCALHYQGDTHLTLVNGSASGYGTAADIEINRVTNLEWSLWKK